MTRLLILMLVAAGCSSTGAERWDEIQGAEWILHRIDGKPALPGTAISLTFGTGRLYGQAQNRYAAEYVREETKLTIERVGATRKHLDDPPGAMEQEARYLKLLPEADNWTYGGGWLELKRGDTALLSFKLKASTSRD